MHFTYSLYHVRLLLHWPGQNTCREARRLSASVAGTNEYGPGNEVQLTITIQNTGLNEFKFIQRGIIDREDLPNTAKSVTVGLSAGNAPVVIKSDPQMLGDIKGTGSANAVFTIKINTRCCGWQLYTPPFYQLYLPVPGRTIRR